MRRGDNDGEIKRQLCRMAFVPSHLLTKSRRSRLISAEELQKRLTKGLPSIDRKAAKDSWERDDRRRLKGY